MNENTVVEGRESLLAPKTTLQLVCNFFVITATVEGYLINQVLNFKN